MGITQSKKRRTATGRWGLLYRALISLSSVLLVFWAGGWFTDYRNHVAESRDASGNLWRLFVAALFLLIAGMLVGLAARSGPPTGRFDWRRPAALGLIPGLLAMTLPMFIWRWPMTTMDSPLWSFRAEFLNDGNAAAMWMLVGVAIASGFETTRS